MNDLFQFFKQMSGKLGSNVYAGVQKPSTPQHHSFLRQLQRELKEENPIYCPLEELPVVIFDLETTGFYPEKGDQIISIGAVKMTGSEIETGEPPFYSLIYHDRPLRTEIVELTNIRNEDLAEAPPAADVLLHFFNYVQSRALIAHHSSHEKAFMQKTTWDLWRKRLDHRIIDTSLLSQLGKSSQTALSLEEACRECGVEIKNRHNALGDALMTARIWGGYLEKARGMGCKTLLDAYSHLAKPR
ncbi:exonuclease domain-containing protein [Neobacillus sp. SM06]|uniref:exonuclease domain-containing protein n=1 Tax=Neobacillus sp. SM06 TaxID=3422492 RepID=UPI003D293FE3